MNAFIKHFLLFFVFFPYVNVFAFGLLMSAASMEEFSFRNVIDVFCGASVIGFIGIIMFFFYLFANAILLAFLFKFLKGNVVREVILFVDAEMFLLFVVVNNCQGIEFTRVILFSGIVFLATYVAFLFSKKNLLSQH